MSLHYYFIRPSVARIEFTNIPTQEDSRGSGGAQILRIKQIKSHPSTSQYIHLSAPAGTAPELH